MQIQLGRIQSKILIYVFFIILAANVVMARSRSLFRLPSLFHNSDNSFRYLSAGRLLEPYIQTAATINGFPNCHLETRVATTTRANLLTPRRIVSVTFIIACFNSTVRDISIFNPNRAVCSDSSLDPSPAYSNFNPTNTPTLCLEELRLKPGSETRCPPGKDLIRLHHKIAQRIGAKQSKLMDMSTFPIFRSSSPSSDYIHRIPSLTWFALFQDQLPAAEMEFISEPRSYYSQFGYHRIYPVMQVKDRLINSINYITHITVGQVILQLNFNTTRGKKIYTLLFPYSRSDEALSLKLVILVRRLHASSRLSDREDCAELLTGVFRHGQYGFLETDIYDETPSMYSSISALNQGYYMEKTLE